MACARCGCGVYQTEDLISLNKIWHKCCFTCRICKEKLDKCSAKIYHGEIYCEKCYKIMNDGICPSLCSPQIQPCRVVSSPSSICLPKSCKVVLPNDDCRKKCNKWFPDDGRMKPVRSCSCIPDIKKAYYCFPYPIPPEVANYYNRNMRKKNQPKHCCPDYCNCCQRKPKTRIKMRKVSPTNRTPSPPKCKGECNQPCTCQNCDIRCITPKCCPRPCSPKPCSCTCPPVQQESCCPPKQCPPKQSCCPGILKESQAIYCPTLSREDCCLPNKQGECQSPKCCCNCSSPKPCPKAKQCQKKCFKSPVRFCIPNGRKLCGSRCPNNPPKCSCCSPHQDCMCCSPKKTPKYCICGNLNPCNCKMGQVRTICQTLCVRCGQKVYAAEKIIVTSGAYHTSCFSCYCCHKLLDVRNMQEHCNEIYCRNCYNNFFGIQYYGYGSS